MKPIDLDAQYNLNTYAHFVLAQANIFNVAFLPF